MKTLCIIPARGGSNRIPRKNIKLFLGFPIISYSIKAAIESNLFDEVMVSTDDDEIAEISMNLGAKVPFLRSKKNADDFATTISVILEVIEEYEKNGKIFEKVCCIYPTAPFVTGVKLEKAHSLLIKGGYDTVFPIMEFSSPIQRALKLKNGVIEPFFEESIISRSQDLEKSYHDAGQFYWSTVNSLKAKKKLWTDNTGGIIIDHLSGQDIDNLDDWELAELKYQRTL